MFGYNLHELNELLRFKVNYERSSAKAYLIRACTEVCSACLAMSRLTRRKPGLICVYSERIGHYFVSLKSVKYNVCSISGKKKSF